MHLRRKLISKSFEMDQNLHEKCVVYMQVHSGVDVKLYPIFIGKVTMYSERLYRLHGSANE